MSARHLVGVFVGGRGQRMGGVAKGNLMGPDGRTLLARLVELAPRALPGARVVLVGDAKPYADLGVTALRDAARGIGPIGGLAGLLAYAEQSGYSGAVALSCDLPYLGAGLLQRLARELPEALALAPRVDGRWSSLTARYAVDALPAVLLAVARGAHSLQGVFEDLGADARELSLSRGERLELRDWDRPEDMRG